MIRLPFAPIEEFVQPTPESATAELALRLDATRSAVHRWRKFGIPVFSADKAAIALGVHPCLIWPEWFDVPAERPQRRLGRALAPCGTTAARRRHRHNGEALCDACQPKVRAKQGGAA